MTIGVYVNTFFKEIDEFLVNLDYLESILPKFGLRMDGKPMKFDKMYDSFSKEGLIKEELTEEGKLFSFFNVSITILKTEDIMFGGGVKEVDSNIISNYISNEIIDNSDFHNFDIDNTSESENESIDISNITDVNDKEENTDEDDEDNDDNEDDENAKDDNENETNSKNEENMKGGGSVIDLDNEINKDFEEKEAKTSKLEKLNTEELNVEELNVEELNEKELNEKELNIKELSKEELSKEELSKEELNIQELDDNLDLFEINLESKEEKIQHN